MKLTEKRKMIDNIADMCGLIKTPAISMYRLLEVLSEDEVVLIYEYLYAMPKEKQRKFLAKSMGICLKLHNKMSISPEQLRKLFDGYSILIDIENETKPVNPNKENGDNLNLSETNGVDIRGCQCFTCRNKISKDALVGFYEGSYEAYKDAIDHVRDLFPDDSSPDWLKIKSLISRLNYERDCSGALLEDVETGNYWRIVNAKIH